MIEGVENPWRKVLATHEERQALAGGPWLGDEFPGVALPSRKALNLWVALRVRDRYTFAQVADVGPWCIDDDSYVFGTQPPRAWITKGQACPLHLGGHALASVPDGRGGTRPAPISNGAGIDLFPRTAAQLGIPPQENVEIEWRWAHLLL